MQVRGGKGVGRNIIYDAKSSHLPRWEPDSRRSPAGVTEEEHADSDLKEAAPATLVGSAGSFLSIPAPALGK